VNNKKLIDFYNIVKVRPTLLHQLLLWNFDVTLSDVDVVFIGDYFDLFNKDNENDFQVQWDSKEISWIRKNASMQWSINFGYYQVFPTHNVLTLMPIWLEKMYKAPKLVDQKALKSLIKHFPFNWTSDESFRVDTSKLLGENTSMSIRFLDPMLAVNIGGLFQDGQELWKRESKVRNISLPILCHFFHLGSNEKKLDHMKMAHWLLIKNEKCLTKNPEGLEWKMWN
jgi:hypothetical protein